MQPVPLATLWGQGGQQEVEDFTRAFTLGAEDAAMRLEECGVAKCNEDPQFHDHKKVFTVCQAVA